MAKNEIDDRRRRFLVAATTAAGGVATVVAAIPFVTSMLPSAKARAGGAPVAVDISKLDPGMLLTVEWRGKPIWILHRTEDMLGLLGKQDEKLRDPLSQKPQQPEYCRNATRSIRPEYLVAIGLCTHLGCIPTYRPGVAPADLGSDWQGGFFCPCHGSKFDLAGRVFKNVPAPLNLEIPPHRYPTDVELLIGEETRKA
ncbi:MAG: ubiquinol-cytochrome c reductase iron-sulfur subunit [Betaproteobacteria bacterium]|nr:ubiquinol-cytochrome c reductase iron-sulfur subunit [Betaproteobacteria bacterium]